jgi:hypothetical protein
MSLVSCRGCNFIVTVVMEICVAIVLRLNYGVVVTVLQFKMTRTDTIFCHWV